MKIEKIFSFESTTDIKKIIEHDGFIGPDGEFYLVSKKYKHTPTHSEWAEEYVIKNLDFVKQLANPKGSLLYVLSYMKEKIQLLIHYYGYVKYGHTATNKEAYFIFPNPNVADRNVTSKQKDLIYEICILNNEFDALPNDFEEQYKDDVYETAIDRYIAKREYENKMK